MLHFYFQTIALFNAKEHEETMLHVEELVAFPNVDTLACHVVEVSTTHFMQFRWRAGTDFSAFRTSGLSAYLIRQCCFS
jgi:hypothetical protein